MKYNVVFAHRDWNGMVELMDWCEEFIGKKNKAWSLYGQWHLADGRKYEGSDIAETVGTIQFKEELHATIFSLKWS